MKSKALLLALVGALLSVGTVAAGAHLLAPAIDISTLWNATTNTSGPLSKASPAATPFPAQSAPDVEDETLSGLVVEPKTALFDTHLWPGESETRSATLTNTTDSPMSVTLTAVLGPWSGHEHAPEHLLIATSPSRPCTDEGMADAPRTTLAAAAGLDHGVLEPHTTTPLCIRVELPTTATLPTPATNIVHFEFHTLEGPTDDSQTPHPLRPVLAFTGANLTALLLLAAGSTLAGILVLVVRRQARRVTPTLHDMASR